MTTNEEKMHLHNSKKRSIRGFLFSKKTLPKLLVVSIHDHFFDL